MSERPNDTLHADMRTRAVHAGRRVAPAAEAHVPAIDLSTTYALPSLGEATECLDRMIEGRDDVPNPVYARLHNPTVAVFERALADLEGAEAAVAFASGMAAISALLIAASERGRHVVAIRPVYGGSDHLLTTGLLGNEVTWVDEGGVADAIRPDTALVFVETPANPTLDVVDIVKISRAAGTVPVAVDSTFATPILQTPLDHGATFVVHSATKFLGGHGDVLGGVIATSEAHARALRQVRMATGGVLHPLAGYLLARGLQTLPIRVTAQQRTASILAARLLAHPAVRTVHYPGVLRDPERRRVIERQMRGPGSLLSFRVHGGPERARRWIESLGLVTSAVSLGSVDTLAQIPAELTHRVVDGETLDDAGVPGDLIRLSVGLEAADDLWTDLVAALERSEPKDEPPSARDLARVRAASPWPESPSPLVAACGPSNPTLFATNGRRGTVVRTPGSGGT